MNTFFFLLMLLSAFCIPILLIVSLIFFLLRNQKAKKFLKITGFAFGLSIVSVFGFYMTTSPEEKQTALKELEEEKDNKESNEKIKQDDKEITENQPTVKDTEKISEKQTVSEQPIVDSQPKKTDKDIYEEEIKPKYDAMLKEYDDIWSQHWKPVWEEINANPNATALAGLKPKMDVISEKYGELSNQNSNFDPSNKLSSSTLKEHISKFRVEFGSAANYRGNAARAVSQGIKGTFPLENRMQESIKSVKISDEKLINAIAAKVQLESELGIEPAQ